MNHAQSSQGNFMSPQITGGMRAELEIFSE